MTIHYLFKRFYELGPRKFFWRVCETLKQKSYLFIDQYFVLKFKIIQKIIFPKPSHKQLQNFQQKLRKWNKFLSNNSLNPESFFQKDLYFHLQQVKNGKTYLFQRYVVEKEKGFSLWHADWIGDFKFYTKKHLPFFANIYIPITTSKKFLSPKKNHPFGAEIKVCWDRNRLQNESMLASLLNQKNISKFDKDFIQAKLNQNISSLLDSSVFLCGANWQNPMEVAIRSINLIHIFSCWQNKSKKLLSKIYQNLLKHQYFIHRYLETSATPNNHYLADLLGLAFLNIFLNKKTKKDLKLFFAKIFIQFQNQMLNDGSFYEGSTSYHKLNLEMLSYLFLLAKCVKIKPPPKLSERFAKAKKFFHACSFKTFYLKSGDSDSGQILFGLTETSHPRNNLLQIQRFNDFGLIVVKNDNFFLSLRNFNFNPTIQPSGHFHHEQLAINLVINQHPIFTSLGTPSYTSQANLRNYARSHKAHNTFFFEQEFNEFEKYSNNLFKLNLRLQIENKGLVKNKIKNETQIVTITGINNDFLNFGITKIRKIRIFYNINQKKIQQIEIEDQVKFSYSLKIEGLNWAFDLQKTACENKVWWNWIFDPALKVKKLSPKNFVCLAGDTKIYFISSLIMKKKLKSFASSYLHNQNTSSLSGFVKGKIFQKSNETFLIKNNFIMHL